MSIKECLKRCHSEEIYIWKCPTTIERVFDMVALDLPFDHMSLIVTDGEGEEEMSVLMDLRQFEPNKISIKVQAGSSYRGGLREYYTEENNDTSFVYNIDIHEGKPSVIASNEIKHDSHKGDFIDMTANYFLKFLQQMKNKQTVMGKQKRSWKVKKKKYVTKLVTYVTNKKYVQEVKGHREIEWTHCFKVCGHWRKIAGVGKDRQGEYCVNGFTWVKPYEKNKELEKVDKIRVLKG
jgi:hypothetical protein